MATPLWTISILTIPGREEHLQRLLQSLRPATPSRSILHIVYNKPIREDLAGTEREIRSWADQRAVEVYFNNGDPTISGGRNFQLNLVKTPLICFIDDDLTAEGSLLEVLEETMRRQPAALVGLPSVSNETGRQFKPRDSTPHIDDGEFRWCTVQGMLAATYTDIIRDVGGFNPRRKFWGEWTELNLRLWRHGLPTGYRMTEPLIRHWEDAPESPTRNLDGRELHILWGIICTALEYDAVDVTDATEAFWRLVEDRYLEYSFGESLSPRTVLQATLSLMPELSAAWNEITNFREQARRHPFDFVPFQPLTKADLDRILPTARRLIGRRRRYIWPDRTSVVGKLRGWVGNLARGGKA